MVNKMKKYFYIIITIFFTGIFTACNDDIDNKLPGLSEKERPQNIVELEHNFVAEDFKTIIQNLKAKRTVQDTLLAKQVESNKKFSKALSPSQFIPYLLPSLVNSPDPGSFVSVTYDFDNERDSVISELSTESYRLLSDDYATVWGDPSVDAFTPSHSPENYMPTILKRKFGIDQIGKYKNVAYYYSEKEPFPANVINALVDESVDNNPGGTGTGIKFDMKDWINVDLQGNIYWQARNYSNNKYIQVSSYKSGALNDVWLITPEIDLSTTTNPYFKFDIVVGNYNATCLKVLISEDFDGTPANILTAKWEDITSQFKLPTPSSGYTTWESAGNISLKSHNNKKVYIAFRYEGDDLNSTKKTSTYQIDNVIVYEEIPGMKVENKTLVYDLYESTGSAWRKITDKSVVILQPEDYTLMGINYLSTEQAPNYLPQYLTLKYPFAQDGNSKKVIYRTKANTCYADEYIKTDGKWNLNTFIVSLTDKFVYTSNKEWVFDPTFVVKMAKEDYNIIVDYVKENQGLVTPSLINKRNDPGEFYYGFSAYYSNVSYRDTDRSFDPSYAALTDNNAKWNLMNRRVEEAIAIYLSIKFPNATPLVNGIVQEAKITVLIYKDNKATKNNVNWTYRFKCIGDKQWEFLERISDSGEVNKAGEY